MYHQFLFVIISILIYNPNSETKCPRGGILVIREIMPNALLKLLVKDKPLYSRKVPVSVKGCQMRPPSMRGKQGDWQLKTLRTEKEDYSRQAPTRTQKLAVETPEEREATLQQRSTNQRERLECYSTRCRENVVSTFNEHATVCILSWQIPA